jgi:glycerate 2-kinase
VIRECYEKHGVKRVVVGSGGSAFVDGGFWCMTSGLGVFRAYDKAEREIHTDQMKPNQIKEVERLEVANESKRKMLDELEVIMPCDVTNPMLGPKGAAYVFGP